MGNSDARVYVVDDDRNVSESLRILLQSVALNSVFYPTAEQFLKNYPNEINGQFPRCLLLDVGLPGISGFELQQELRRRGYQLPVLVITGNSTVPLAVKAIKQGAMDFLEKPLHRQMLIDQINRAIEHDARQRPLVRRRQEMKRRLETLTPREREVLQLLVQGKSNKRLACELGITIKTAAKHTSRVFSKLHADNAVELSQLLGSDAEFGSREDSAEILSEGSAR